MKNINFGIIGGCGSSGTTLLTTLLGRIDNVVTGPELNLFNHEELYSKNIFSDRFKYLLQNRGASKNYFPTNWFLTEKKFFDINNDFAKTCFHNSPNPSNFVNQIIKHILQSREGCFLVEKTPSNVYFFENILEMFPDVPVIHVIRDGRDVVSSLMRRGFSLFSAGTRWLYDTTCGISNRSHANYLEIKYEDLTTNPVETLNIVCEHLKITFYSSTIYQNSFSNNKHNLNEVDYRNHEIGSLWNNWPSDPITTSSIGRYKKVLSEKQLFFLNKISLKEDISSKLKTNINSFESLLKLLEYDCLVTKHNYKRLSDLDIFLIENADYLHRLKYFWQSKICFPFPRKVTFIAK